MDSLLSLSNGERGDMQLVVNITACTVGTCNDSFVDETGFDRENVLGASVFTFFHAESQEKLANMLEQISATGIAPKSMRMLLQRRDDSKLPVLLICCCEKLWVTFILQDIRDITVAEENSLAEKRDLQSQIDAIPD